MRRADRIDTRTLLCAAMCIALGCMLGTPTAWAQDDDEDVMEQRLNIVNEAGIGGGDSSGSSGPAEGTVAPDFSLTPLKFYEFKIDEKEITENNAGDLYKPVSLSDFKGKKPVVLIFGSYT